MRGREEKLKQGKERGSEMKMKEERRGGKGKQGLLRGRRSNNIGRKEERELLSSTKRRRKKERKSLFP